MGGSKKHKTARAKRLRAQRQRLHSQPQKEPSRRKFVVNWALILAGLGVVLSLPSACSTLTTKVLVTGLGSFKDTDPLSARFQVVNDGNWSIYQVTVEAEFDAFIGGLKYEKNIIRTRPKWMEEIEAGSKPVTYLGFPVQQMPPRKSPDDHIEMTVQVKYRASLTWWSRTTTRHFFARRLPTGEMEWTEAGDG